MTADELLAREAIRDLLARYNMAGDRVRAEAFAGVFAEDGVLETAAHRLEGRAAILAWMKAWATGGAKDQTAAQDAAAPNAAPRIARHHLAASEVTLTAPDRAQARTNWTVYSDIGPDHGGVYLDELHCSAGVWLIGYRRARTEWNAPASRFAAKR